MVGGWLPWFVNGDGLDEQGGLEWLGNLANGRKSPNLSTGFGEGESEEQCITHKHNLEHNPNTTNQEK